MMLETLAKGFSYPHIEIYERVYEGAFNGYTAKAEEGYLFYEKDTFSPELDPETGEIINAVYYYRIRLFPPNYNMENFNLVAVREDTVEEKYVF